MNYNADSCSANGYYWFNGCDNLKTVNIGNNVKYIPENFIYEKSKVTTITIGDSVKAIDNRAFWGCTGLTNVKIGNQVTKIGMNAFTNCFAVDTIYSYAQNPPAIYKSTFDEVPNTAEVIVPCNTKENYTKKAWWNMFVNIKELCDGIIVDDNSIIKDTVYIHDTVTIVDTLTITVHDTVTLFDTITNEITLYDTVTLTDTITLIQIDTVTLVDTITLTLYDTVNTIDTVYLHDTITPCGITRTYIYAEINAGETYMGYGFTESDAGEYVQTLQTEDGCDSIVTLILQVTAGIDKIQAERIISIYPNPAHDRVTIHADGDIKIIDNKGQVVREIKNIKGVKDINVSNFEAGVYYINVGKHTQPLIIE
ncbi:MAG: leucine-rich repeat domain-containing protein [Bacteroidales bacterium]|nr:leucine-rich repeat domain-containing protein [Bacteroidales bacterium]